MVHEFVFVEAAGKELAEKTGAVLVSEAPQIEVQGKSYHLFRVDLPKWEETIQKLEKESIDYQLPTLKHAFGIEPLVQQLSQLSALERAMVVAKITSFLDFLATFTGKGTFYHSEQALCQEEEKIHSFMRQLDRRLYYWMLLLDGATDRSRMTGVLQLLATGDEVPEQLREEEWRALQALGKSLPPQRRFKLYLELAESRINNRRSRRWILEFLLQAPQLELWAVKYRKKLRRTLQHVLSKRRASILRSILAKAPEERSEKEAKMVHQWAGRFVPDSIREKVLEIVGFILGVEERLTLPLLKAYHEAKEDLTMGENLPFETLEGIRSTFHADLFSRQEVLEWTKEWLTKGQKLAMQRTAEKEGVKIEVNFRSYDAVRLYLYAFERGWNSEIEEAIQYRAQKLARELTLPEEVGILLDASQSMMGSREQPLRPMAVALALRDALVAASPEAKVVVCGGQAENNYLIRPQGATQLAEGLLELVKAGISQIFVLSDGYENSPAGRTQEVLDGLAKLGQQPQIIQISPTVGTESQGVRALAPGRVLATSLFQPESLPLALFRIHLHLHPERALKWLEKKAQKKLAKGKESKALPS